MIRHTSARCLLLILLWPATGSAQTGSIRGSVVDQTDLVLPGATVTLRGNGVPRTAYSDEQGHFELAGVAPGTYTLRVSLAGFSDATVEDVTVSGAPLELSPVELQLASFGDTVVVTASRHAGRLIDDPRQPGQTVGGALYPLDSGTTAFGTGFANRGTSQPKFDVRVDQELSDATLTYAGGVAGTEGLVHSGIGPFDIQRGSYLGYGKVTYTRGDLRLQFFTNILDGQSPNLLLPDPATGRPLQLDFKTQTYDGEIGHAVVLGNRHRLSYGGNVRQNNFDVPLAPLGEDRLEGGGYLQDEIFWDRFRLVLGARVDKFGNLSNPKVSPRIAFLVKPAEDHSITLSYNRAFRAPSVINNALQTSIVSPVDLSALAPLLPPGRTSVFVNARIVSMRLRPVVVRSACSSQHRRAAWRASARSRPRSPATASRRLSR